VLEEQLLVDDGLGLPQLWLLESNDIPHPAIEALFTVDEETGMTGALELKGGGIYKGNSSKLG
jgi:di/tripeptidase